MGSDCDDRCIRAFRPWSASQGPLLKFDLEGLPSDHALQSGDLRFVFLQEISCMEIVVKGAGFILADPNTDQVAGEIVTLRQRMQSLACNVFLSDPDA